MGIDDRQEALWRQQAAHRAGPRIGVPLGLGGPPARSCASAGGRSGSVSARWSVSSVRSVVTIISLLLTDS